VSRRHARRERVPSAAGVTIALETGGLRRTPPVPGSEANRTAGAVAGLEETRDMDHYIPKRRVPVTYWSTDHGVAEGQIFLDLDPSGSRHQTILAKLNSPSRFIPVATGSDGRIELVSRVRLVRLVPGPDVLHSDVFTRGFAPSREEDAEVWLTDGSSVTGRVWMPLERPTQRISDFMNQRGREFFVLLSAREVQLVNAAAVARMAISESAGAPLTTRGSRMPEVLPT
jgi:hypothetical protein